ncbi:MAG TPA: hypothetical protein VNK26_01595 [Pyrinomonadaceae bacterium]|nr:hypothetical protein [Pyrinomonadaceae bacterium]
MKLCPQCDAFCNEITKRNAEQDESLPTSRKGYLDFRDFIYAIRFPFKTKSTFVVYALIFALLITASKVVIFGGILFFCGIVCLIAANTLAFGILANVSESFAAGRLRLNLIPDFDDFSIWDSAVHPLLVNLSALIISFAPFLVIVGLISHIVSAEIIAERENIKKELQKIPGTQHYAGRELNEQSLDVKKVLNQIAANKNLEIEENLDQSSASNSSKSNSSVNANLSDGIRSQIQSGHLAESETGNCPATIEGINCTNLGHTKELSLFDSEHLAIWLNKVPGPLILLLFAVLIWGIIYYPAALCVAGYTRLIVTTLNPLVAFDVVRSLKGEYIKLVVVFILAVAAWLVTYLMLNFIFLPLELPLLGNLPATFLSSIMFFYLIIVYSGLIGLNLYHSADKLGIGN